MPLTGHDNLQDVFLNLVKKNSLAHGYIFFGEPQVGKYSFALALASFLEGGEFKAPPLQQSGMPKMLLQETYIGKPENDSLGIEAVREVRRFLAQKPVVSRRRAAILDGAHTMTPEAQHAALKVAEEPPETGLLILITPNVDSLMPTLTSRFQKIHFPRVPTEIIETMLVRDYDVSKSRAGDFAKRSLGRPGRAVALATNPQVKEAQAMTSALIESKRQKRAAIEELVANPETIQPFLTELIAYLAKDPVKNYDTLKSVTACMAAMSRFSTNKRLQLETALWNI